MNKNGVTQVDFMFKDSGILHSEQGEGKKNSIFGKNDFLEAKKITRKGTSQQEMGMPGKIRRKESVAKITMGRGGGTPKITGKGCLDFQRKWDFF
jgi:hypothetical protein